MARKKHQINQLAFDAKAREVELMTAAGNMRLSKAQTRAKYGW